LALLPGDRGRPAARQRVAGRARGASPRRRHGGVGGPQRHPRHHGGRLRDPARDGPDLTWWRGRAPQGVRPSPNIWHHTATYEVENRAVDPDGHLEQALRETATWRARTVLDVGCGSGFHLPFFAREAAHVVGVEPHPPLVQL